MLINCPECNREVSSSAATCPGCGYPIQKKSKRTSSSKLPNGYGSVYKLQGNRRNPYVAKKTKGWSINPETGKATQLYITVGYYPTRKDALTALSEYNANPYDVSSKITLKEVYEKWSDEHFKNVSDSNVKGYKAAWKLCNKIENMKIVDIKLDHLQMIVNESGKNTPTLRKLKVLLGLMYKYAVIHEIIPQEKNKVEYLDIKRAGNPNALDRKPFTKSELKHIWKIKDTNIYYSVILILIYTGVRISELLDLKKEDIHLEEKWFFVAASKTRAGVRAVPIAEKILPFFQSWMQKDCEYLICTPENNHFLYKNYYDSYWKPLMENLNMNHRPHDTRHTCISLLAAADVNDKIIKKIIGHKGQSVTENVYTHFEIEELLDAINKI